MNNDDRHQSGAHDAHVDAYPTGPVETQLRAALLAEAQSIDPTDRLDAILGAARADAPPAATVRKVAPLVRRWLAPSAAAAAAALVAGGLWAANRPADGTSVSGSTTASPAVTTPAAGEASNVPTLSSPATPSATTPGPSSAPPSRPVAARAALPVYRVGVLDGTGSRLGLVRELVPSTTASADPAQRALAAATLSLENSAATLDAGYRALWEGAAVVDVAVRPDLIIVTLTHGATTLSTPDATLAVQQLVWTVQAAAGASGLPPVRFVLADGSTALAGTLTTAGSYNRPTDPIQAATILAPLWIDQPYPRQVLNAGAPVTVSGQASTFEANVEWELRRAGAPIASGSTTATIAAPARGTYSFRTDPLGPGNYSVVVRERSAKDGSVTASWQIPFSVR